MQGRRSVPWEDTETQCFRNRYLCTGHPGHCQPRHSLKQLILTATFSPPNAQINLQRKSSSRGPWPTRKFCD